MNFLTIAITRIKRLEQPAPMPTVTKAEAQSWFAGWWNGIAVGIIIGAAVAAIVVKGAL
jgi:hypothetical protein